MKPYADSSFIVALYLRQVSSGKAVAIMAKHQKPLPFTPWHRLEVRNAMRLALFQGVVQATQAKEQLKQLDADVRDESVVRHLAIDWTDVLREAEALGAAHNDVIGCRSADLFHVAAAKWSHCDTFLTFDRKQKAMAEAAGLDVIGA